MNSRCKLVMVIVCTTCFASIWIIYSSRLTFDQKENLQEVTCGPSVEGRKEEAETQKPDLNKTCSCDKCMPEDNTYFEQRYDKSVNPFLTMDGNPTQDEYNWWKVIQLERGDLNNFKEVKERLLKLFPTKSDMPETHPDRCLTCAVVGNSGNLKGSNNGPRIDAHQFVIRMNHGQTAGFEADVGTRTTHRVMYPESAMDLDNTTHLILFPFKIMDLRWIIEAFTTGFDGRSYAPVKKYIKGNKDLVMVVNPVFMKYVHTSWLHKTGHYPSTGFMTLILAMHICDKVNVFGFGADKDGNWSHYWEELKDKKFKTGIHPGTLEYEILQELAKQNVVTFYRGW